MTVENKENMAPEGDKREFLDALANGLRLLGAFDESHHGFTIQSAAELLGITRAASRRVLLTLSELGYLRQVDRRFEITPRVLDLGYRYFRSLRLSAAARPYLRDLSQRLGVGVALGVLDGTDVVFVERVEAERLIRLDLRAGDRLPAYAHSLGRALLAALPQSRLAQHLPGAPIARPSAFTVADRNALLKELALVREQGFSYVNSELVAGLFGVGIALPSTLGATPAGVNVSSIGKPWDTAYIDKVVLPELRELAARLQPLTEALA